MRLDRLLMMTGLALVGVSIAATVALLWFSAVEIDRTYRLREQQMIERSVENLGSSLTQTTFAQSYWDEAIDNLDIRFSPPWAQQYIGTFFWRTSGWNLISTLDRGDQVTFGMIDGKRAAPGNMDALRSAAAPLIRQVRAAELERGPIPTLREFPTAEYGQDVERPPLALPTNPRRAPPQRLSPIAANSIAKIGDELYLLSATLVQPDGDARPITDRSAMILLGKRLDELIVSGIAHRLALHGVRVVAPGEKIDPRLARAPLRDGDGRVVGLLTWEGRNPGAELVDKVLPALIAFIVLLAIAVFTVLRKGRGLTRELIESERLAAHLAHHDGLTGLPNRRAIEADYACMAEAHASSGQPFAVLCIDIDNFKAINDSLGHPAGDQLLHAAAAKAASLCAAGDTLGRYGGDEFVLLLSNTGAERAADVAHQLVGSLGVPIEIEAGRVFVGASIGILVCEAGAALSASEALRRADLAMYRAKEDGRGRYIFYSAQLDNVVRARRSLQHALHDALANDELTVHYQPQVDGDDNLIGVEALLRWSRAEEFQTSPFALIQLAEETGQIEEISRLVMRKAFADSRRWPHILTAINISPVELRSPDFIPRIEGLIAEAAVDPRRFELEITESVLLGRERDTIDKLERLRAMGFGIVLDDFGTGYCGLSYLHLYPVDKVKIDMSFVALLGREERGASLIDAIISLAGALGLAVVAEGVELPTQRRMLAEMGCSNIQGFLVGRAVPAEVIAPLRPPA